MTGSDTAPLTYSNSGVNYGSIDPAKVSAQEAAKSTSKNLTAHGMAELPQSRGESAYVWQEGDVHKALVVEGLGTKNLVADAMRAFTGKTYYDQVAQDTVAMIVNDLVVVGALPNVINAYFAIGDSAWMEDKQRSGDLIRGWAHACELSEAAWGGGETPALKGIINPETIDLAGSAVGTIKNSEHLVLGDKLTEGDRIVLVESSGIHANGLSMARAIADGLPEGYATKLSDGRSYGEALLTPTHIYVQLVRLLQEQNLDVHYMVNITGHGWRKLMRASKENLSYVIEQVPPVPTEFSFIQEQANASLKEMYGNFNMGAGFAVYAPANQAEKVVEVAQAAGLKAWDAGRVEAGNKSVFIEPLDIRFEGDSLGVRG